jgi:hypothetical protein
MHTSNLVFSSLDVAGKIIGILTGAQVQGYPWPVGTVLMYIL